MIIHQRVKNFETLGLGMFVHFGIYSLLKRGEWIRDFEKMPKEEYLARVTPFVQFEAPATLNLEKLLLLLQGRIGKLSEVTEKSAFFLSLPEYDLSLFENKKNKVTPESALNILRTALPLLEKAETFDNDSIYNLLLSVAEELSCKSGAVMWSLRIAVSGMAVTPGGATEIMEVIGKEESLRRIRLALQK